MHNGNGMSQNFQVKDKQIEYAKEIFCIYFYIYANYLKIGEILPKFICQSSKNECTSSWNYIFKK